MKNISYLFVISFLLLAPLSFTLADSAGPEVSTAAPLTAVDEVPTLFYLTATDTDGVASCLFVVNSTQEAPMNYNSETNRYEITWTFTDDRTANSIRGKCTDSLGNETTGKGRIMSVTEAEIGSGNGDGDADTGSSEVDATEWTPDALTLTSPVLIKTVCPGGEDATHPCRTVYFLDNVGKRHAFPNEKVYFSWYDDWSNIHLVSDETMAIFSLGANLRYKPGVRMIKFPLVNTVYTVAQHGVLRAVTSEAMASALYGTDWNTKIDDVPEVFYSNYSIGDPLADASEYDVQAHLGSVTSINDNLNQ